MNYSTPQPAGSVRRLMRQIRRIMESPGGAQSRLDGFVSTIASNLVADVCSVYLRRPGGQLELCATEGLAQAAVHAVRLAPREGLVGTVASTAEPLIVQDARSHPAFSLQPETDEESLSTFLGVPILRGGRLLGVLTIQNRRARAYGDEEVETLQVAAMVLAEVVADLPDDAEDAWGGIEVRLRRAEEMAGRSLSPGLAIGSVVKEEPHVAFAKLIADDPEGEAKRLDRAVEALRRGVDDLLARRGSALGQQPRDVLDAYRMIANDRGWLTQLKEAAASGLTAEAAVERVRNEQRARLIQSDNPYLRDRVHDLEDLANRLLSHLSNQNGAVAQETGLPENAILVARTIGPAQLLEKDTAQLRGVLLEEGAPFSHTAIVAKALGLPLVGGLEGVLDRVEEGDMVVVDGARGVAQLRPSAQDLETARQRIERSGQRSADFARDRDAPAMTRDGVRVHLYLNAGLSVDLAQLDRTGAEGIGLFRTEFQFLVSDSMPRLTAQTALYSAVADAAGEGLCVFRTLDLGGDKALPYLQAGREDNPAMGWRAVRIALERPALLRYQLRALIAATAGRTLSVMFPLVATVQEFQAARDLVHRELEWADQRGRPRPQNVRIGVMLETPALAYQLDDLLDITDFISVGANDLLQFFFAADRTHPMLAHRYDMFARPALRLLRDIAVACAQANVPVTVCGEAAGHPLEAMALIGLGYRRLSMQASGVGPVKRMVLSLDASQVRDAVDDSLLRGSDLRRDLLDLAERANVALSLDGGSL